MNQTLFHFLNNLALRSPAGDAVIIFMATTFSTITILAVLAFLLFHKDKISTFGHPMSKTWMAFRRRLSEVALIFFSAGTAWVLVQVLKYIFHQPRPFLILDNVRLLFEHGGYNSFPSGHATFFAALATAVFLRHRRAGLILWVGALLIGLARVVSGVHFPADILAGFVLGAIIPFLWSQIFKSD